MVKIDSPIGEEVHDIKTQAKDWSRMKWTGLYRYTRGWFPAKLLPVSNHLEVAAYKS